MATVDFSWDDNHNTGHELAMDSGGIQISDDILLKNAQWFVVLRWVVIFVLVMFQIISSFFSDYLLKVEIVSKGYWPVVIALVLAVANVLYILALNRRQRLQVGSPATIIWMQIILDLVCLAVVVHYLGSVNTPAPFLFILHIALACVFFSIRSSFLITCICTLLYSMVILIEYTGIIDPHSVLAENIDHHSDYSFWFVLFNTVAIITLFYFVWGVVSRLSKIIRAHEAQLIKSEAETRETQIAKDKYVLHVTHQLKSPLAVISTNIALLTDGYCGEFPDQARDVLERIDTRAKVMGDMVLDMLKLESIKTGRGDDASESNLDIGDLMLLIVDNMKSMAKKRNITIQTSIENNVFFKCNSDQIRVMLNNLLSNAINYSLDGGIVAVRCPIETERGSFALSISDQGIGISEDKLAHVFDEYFRTREAIKHHNTSTGVGLSIVKNVARNHGIRVGVSSKLGSGTEFTLYFP